MEAVLEVSLAEAFGLVRKTAASQGWVLATGGTAQRPDAPMAFRRGLGSFAPSWQLVVKLVPVSPASTRVVVAEWRGPVPVEGPNVARFLRAIGAPVA